MSEEHDEKQLGGNGAIRNGKGQFVKGHPGLPGAGRPKGTTLDFMTVLRKKARENNFDLEDLVWAVSRGLFARAASGDAGAARVILDRVCGAVERTGGVEVNVDARQVRVAEPPSGPALGSWVEGLMETAKERGWLSEEGALDPLDPTDPDGNGQPGD